MKQVLFFLIRHFVNTFALISPEKAGQLALRLFAKPRKGRLKPKDRIYLETARWGTVQASGLKVRYYVWEQPDTGFGPTVLLIHGWESNSARWRNLAGQLHNAGCRVVSLDAPAHGDSDGEVFSAITYSEFIAALMDEMHIDAAVGHSAGGMALTFFAKQYPNRLSKIILMGVPFNLEYILNQYMAFMGYAPRVLAAMDAYLYRHFGHPLAYYSVEEMAKSLTEPCLIIHDKKDKIVPFSGAERIHQNWKDSVFLKTKGLGHSLQGSTVYEAAKRFILSPVPG